MRNLNCFLTCIFLVFILYTNGQEVQKSTVRIWPNPATDFIYIETPDMLQSFPVVVRVTNLQGQELIRSVYNDRLDISSLSPGVYIIILEINRKPAGYARLMKSR